MLNLLCLLLLLSPGDLITIESGASYTDAYGQAHIERSNTYFVVSSPAYDKPVYLTNGYDPLADGMRVRVFIYGQLYEGIQLRGGDVLINNTIIPYGSPAFQLPR